MTRTQGEVNPKFDAVPNQHTVAKDRKKRWWRWLWRIPLYLLLFSVLQVLVLRVVDPPFSMVMALRQLDVWTGAGQNLPKHIWYEWKDMDDISPYLAMAVIAAEDQQFAHHAGFDLEAIEKARKHNARGGKVRGASTISQQVSKNLFLWSGRSWIRKGLEVWYTFLIEKLWPKSRILEMYVNIAEFGNGIYGAEAAAKAFWGKSATQLSPAEAARLAAVLPNPRRYNAVNPGPYVQRRTQWIERNMRNLGGASYLNSLDTKTPEQK